MRRWAIHAAALGGAIFAFAACKPSLDDDPSRVDRPRVLAVRSVPAEAKPGEAVDLYALYTDGVGAPTTAPLSWGFCATRRALAEPTALSAACLSGEDGGRLPVGQGQVVHGVMPKDACRVFGPDPPVAKAGESAGRPADPDATGGYYQPGIVSPDLGEEASFEVRVRCGLAGATQATVAELERRYTPNENPVIAGITVLEGARLGPTTEDDELLVAPGARVRLRLSWPTCEGTSPCGGAESYVAFDPTARVVDERREAMRVAWLGTTGTFDTPRTGRDEADVGSDSDDTWTAPLTNGPTVLWFVLRDSRGGAAFRSLRVRVGDGSGASAATSTSTSTSGVSVSGDVSATDGGVR